MDTIHLLEMTEVILREPTAPFHEARVRNAIIRLLAEHCPHVEVQLDGFGNVIARYSRGNVPAPRYAFTAHMDHPGWVLTDQGEGKEFLGGVPRDYLEANLDRVEDFGAFGMWALPAFETRDGKIYSRACDDLIGCAAIIAMFADLENEEAECDCFGLFTRAEEVGFVGAIHIARDGWLSAEGITVVSLETSSERPPARLDAGPIIRVGDKVSIFDPGATTEMLEAAVAGKIPHQRCLMGGGTCEATAFQAYGIRSAALCIALGNYHNCAPDSPRIEAEFVSIRDYQTLIALCTQIAKHPPEVSSAIDPGARLRESLERRLAHYRPYFTRDRAEAVGELAA